ncbi:MAG: prepilin-type N-terminal cleavage/methylation domain-containing protein [Gammaproteobacteria bacterium]|nr:prepilin-type N-terminal cleavage/methylation domain-containing protein [Gammaproteobacteria bacterium]
MNEIRMIAPFKNRRPQLTPTNFTSSKRQGGFTLIEIAIVLVIIGLLLGGVLKGQELINTARVRALNNTVDGVTAAWFSFQDRYRSFPGDYTQATINLPGAPADGNGNGQVGIGAGGADSPTERANVWVHLQAAGYITGNYNAANVAVDEYGCSLQTCPDNGFGVGMNLSFGEQVRGAPNVDAHELITGRGIPVEVLAELDRKIDDGEPETGAMQLGAGGTGWVSGDSDACQRVVTGTSIYEVQAPSPNCAAVFRIF